MCQYNTNSTIFSGGHPKKKMQFMVPESNTSTKIRAQPQVLFPALPGKGRQEFYTATRSTKINQSWCCKNTFRGQKHFLSSHPRWAVLYTIYNQGCVMWDDQTRAVLYKMTSHPGLPGVAGFQGCRTFSGKTVTLPNWDGWHPSAGFPFVTTQSS